MEKKFVPYEQEHELTPLLLVICVVNLNSEKFFRDALHEHEAFFVVSTHGYGTSTAKSVGEVLGLNTHTKQALFAVMRKNKWSAFKKVAQERISTSDYTKGIAVAMPLDGVAGVSIYKLLANIQKLDKPISKNKLFQRRNYGKRKD